MEYNPSSRDIRYFPKKVWSSSAKFNYPAMQWNIQEKRILTHTTTNASKLTSDYFVVARATYSAKHVISCRIYPHSVQKFISYGADNKPRLHSYYLLYNAEGNNCCLLWSSGKEILKLCEMEEGILCNTESSTCGTHCCTRCLIVILNLFMSLHDSSKRNSIIIYIYIYIYIYVCVCVCVATRNTLQVTERSLCGFTASLKHKN
jgi:hypothetical protein